MADRPASSSEARQVTRTTLARPRTHNPLKYIRLLLPRSGNDRLHDYQQGEAPLVTVPPLPLTPVLSRVNAPHCVSLNPFDGVAVMV